MHLVGPRRHSGRLGISAILLAACWLAACAPSAPAPPPAPSPTAPLPAASTPPAAAPGGQGSPGPTGVVAASSPVGPAPSPAAAASAAPPSPPAQASAPTAAPGNRPTLTAAYVAPVAAMAPLWMAADSGSFDRRGVSVNVRLIAANAAVAALLAKEVDVLEISGPAVLSADLHGAPLVFIGAGLNHAILSLMVAPSVQSAADLRGKELASDRPGTPNDYAMQAALSLLSLKPTDVQLLPLGSADAQLGALLSGQVAGAILGPPQSFQAEKSGFHELQNTFSVPYQNVGVVVQRDRIDELMPALVPFLAGYRDGIMAFNAQPDLAKQVLQKYSKEDNPEILDRTYQFHRTVAPFQEDLQVTREGLKSMLTFLTATVPEAASATPDQFVDTRVLDRLPSP